MSDPKKSTDLSPRVHRRRRGRRRHDPQARAGVGPAANSAVRLGLLGCGGRGLNVTASFLQHTSAVVVALGDMFLDSLEAGKAKLDLASQKYGKPVIDPARLFRGPRAYEQLFASKDVDAVYIATPPYFHPLHLEAALAAGKHVYLEKPVAVDVPGAHKVVALGEKAKGRQSLAVGFQIRHASPYVELAKRIHAGQIGAPVSAEIHYFASAIKRPEWPKASPASGACATGSTTGCSPATSSWSRTSTSSTSPTGCSGPTP